MTNNKYLKLQQKCEETIKRICQSNYEFNEFFKTAAHNYRFGFKNAVAIYSQLPLATAVLSAEQWQRYGRIPKINARSLSLFTNNEWCISVYDYSVTTSSKTTNPSKQLNFFSFKDTPDVHNAIREIYQINDNNKSLADILYSIARQDVENIVSVDFPTELSELYSKIITNMMMSRFSEELPFTKLLPQDKINSIELNDIYDIVIDIFRAEYSTLATELPKYVTLDYNEDIKVSTTAQKTTNEVAKPSEIITQKDIDNILCKGSLFVDSKYRIYEFFSELHNMREKSNFLKKEYGIGGFFYVTQNAYSVSVDYNSKGMRISSSELDYVFSMSYNNMAQRITELINAHLYLNESEQSKYLYYVIEKDVKILNDYQTPNFVYSIGDTVHINNSVCRITALTDFDVTVIQDNAPLFSDTYTREVFDSILISNSSANKHLIQVVDIPEIINAPEPIENQLNETLEVITSKSVDDLKVGDFIEINEDSDKSYIWEIVSIDGDFSIELKNTDKNAPEQVRKTYGHWKEHLVSDGFKYIEKSTLINDNVSEQSKSVESAIGSSTDDAYESDSDEETVLNEPQPTEEEKERIVIEVTPIGDFYEIYGSEAEIASKILDLTLLTRNGNSMVGFPSYAFDKYNKTLNESGYEFSIKLKLLNPNVDDYFIFKPDTNSIDWVRYELGQIVQSAISIEVALKAVQSGSISNFTQILVNNSENELIVDVEDTSDYTKFIDEVTYEKISWDKTSLIDVKDAVIEYATALKLHNNPEVIIEFSEHPALYDIVDRKERFSFVFANELLGSLDMLENGKREDKKIGHYYKTDFKINYSLDSVHIDTYSGRYDLADGEEGLIGHITNFKEYLKHFENTSDDVIEEFDRLIDHLKNQVDTKPINDIELGQISKIITADYGLDIDEETVLNEPQPTEEEKNNIIGKKVEYADKIFKIKSVGMFGQVSLDDISSAEKGLIPIGTVLPYEEVIELLNSQQPKSAENFIISNNSIGVGTPSQRYSNNISAIKLNDKLNSEERPATPEEQEALSRYVGWGGLSDYFSNSKNSELKAILSPIDYDSASRSTLTAFYTPPVVIKAMYKAISNMGFTNGTILDPACGTGHFFGLLPEEMRGSKLYGVELDNISGQIAQKLYPKASIAVQGFEDTNISDNFIDIAVGNVPFGDFKVFDKAYNKYHLRIHDYFFVKTLDKVRPGGIVAFVTSKGTLDKKNSNVRKMLAEKAELLGAIRLPNNTFKSAAGTDVTSDIIFLQKRADTLINNEYPEWVNTETNSDGITMNSYFVHHPEMICGHMEMTTTQYGMDSICVLDEGTTLENKLVSAIEHIKGEYKPYTFDIEDDIESIVANENARNYSYYYDKETKKLYYRENGIMTESKFSGMRANRIIGMIEIADVTRELINAEVDNSPDETVDDLREKLNIVYDKFTKQYGFLNDKANSVFKDDNSYTLLLSLENVVNDENKSKSNTTKADIFTKRTISPHIEISSAESPEEALIISMSQRGTVDLEYMASLTGSTTDELISALNGSSIFLKPYEAEYVTADEYLSGNVKAKLKTAQMAAQSDDKYNINVKALEAVMPKDIPASGISVHLGTTWIPVQYLNQFMIETFKLNRYLAGTITIEYSEYSGTYYINNKNADGVSVEANNRYGLYERNGYKILEDCLNLKTSKVYDRILLSDGSTQSVLNKEKTILAQSKQELLKSKFDEWVFKDPDRRRELTRIYNDKFNCIVNRNFDGSHLTFPGINPNINLRTHQLNAIARMLYGGNTLLAHQVGAGKTFEMIAGAMKLKELGLVHKSLLVVPKHLTGQTGAEFLKLYPAANILVASEKDFTPLNRKRFCTRIATGNYDAIIIGHTQFDKIPLRPETQIEILNEQLDEIIACLEEARYGDMARATTKSLERTKKSIENKLKELKERSAKDNVITFEELGVDQIFIDEAHYFKNLYLYTKMTNVAGVGAGTESGRASDLYTKICYLSKLKPGRGIVFATGTPVSNTMSEMYTMQRYLQPQVLRSMGLQNFDSWATTFGETITSLELAPEGNGYRAKTRFAKFNNIPELMSMFREFADVQTSETLKLPVPDVEREIVEIEPTELQKELIQELGERAEAIRVEKLDPSIDNMLKITNDGRCIALDPRVYEPNAGRGNKVIMCANKIYDIWCQSSDLTQIVFCDLSTPSVGNKKNKDFCVYDDLKSELVALGVPADEIQFIQHHQSATAKEKLFSNVRSGKVRVIVGSTSMMGTGTNIQHKLIALHHLDCPYRPADIEQREGRIIRQGNTNETVKIFNYVTKGTFDAFMYQMVERKQRFISSIMTAKHITDRSVDDIDEATLNYGQIKAVASDNPLVMRKFEIDSAVSKLTSIRDNYLNEHHELEDEVEIHLPKEIHKLETLAQNYKEDVTFSREHPDGENFEIEIAGQIYDNRSKALDAIAECKKDIVGNELLEIGTYRGFKLFLYEEKHFSVSQLNMTVKHNLGYRLELSLSKGVGNLIRLNNLINCDIPEKLYETTRKIEALKHRLESAKEEVKQEFPREEEYQQLLQEQAEINAQLTIADKPTEDDNISENEDMSPTEQNSSYTPPRIRR